jgi:hypothetical protein
VLLELIQIRGTPEDGRILSEQSFFPSFAGHADVNTDSNGAAQTAILKNGKSLEHY